MDLGPVADGIAAFELSTARPRRGRRRRRHEHLRPGEAIARSVLGEHHLQRPVRFPSLIAGIGRGRRPRRMTTKRRAANHRKSAFLTDWSAVFAPICDQLAGRLFRDRRLGVGSNAGPAGVSGSLGAEPRRTHRAPSPQRLGTQSPTSTRCRTRAPFAIASSTWSRRSARTRPMSASRPHGSPERSCRSSSD